MDCRDSYCRFPPVSAWLFPLAVRNETELVQVAALARQLLPDQAQAKWLHSINIQ